MNSMYLSVSEYICVSCAFSFFSCLLVLFYSDFLNLLVCFLKRERKKGLELEGWGGWEDLGGDEGRETIHIVSIYCMKNLLSINE